MKRRLYLRACLMSVFYASLLFIPMHQPGMLVAALLQLMVCACCLAFLLFVVAYRQEIAELLQTAFQQYASLLMALLFAAEPAWPPQNGQAYVTAPSLTPLSPRPPPFLA